MPLWSSCPISLFAEHASARDVAEEYAKVAHSGGVETMKEDVGETLMKMKLCGVTYDGSTYKYPMIYPVPDCSALDEVAMNAARHLVTESRLEHEKFMLQAAKVQLDEHCRARTDAACDADLLCTSSQGECVPQNFKDGEVHEMLMGFFLPAPTSDVQEPTSDEPVEGTAYNKDKWEGFIGANQELCVGVCGVGLQAKSNPLQASWRDDSTEVSKEAFCCEPIDNGVDVVAPTLLSEIVKTGFSCEQVCSDAGLDMITGYVDFIATQADEAAPSAPLQSFCCDVTQSQTTG